MNYKLLSVALAFLYIGIATSCSQFVDAKHDFIKVARTHGVFDIIVHFLLHRAVKPCQPICLVNKDACQRADDKDNDMFQR